MVKKLKPGQMSTLVDADANRRFSVVEKIATPGRFAVTDERVKQYVTIADDESTPAGRVETRHDRGSDDQGEDDTQCLMVPFRPSANTSRSISPTY